MAELKPGPPYVCSCLQPRETEENVRNSKKSYSFDVNKADQIFDILLKDKQLVLSEGHKFPNAEQVRGRKYCKFHNVYGHTTNTCVRFRDTVQKAIEEGRLTFEEKKKASPMKVDTDPFQNTANYAEPADLGICMVGIEEVDDKDAVDEVIEHFEENG